MDLVPGWLLESTIELLKTAVAQTPDQSHLRRVYEGGTQAFISLSSLGDSLVQPGWGITDLEAALAKKKKKGRSRHRCLVKVEGMRP